MSVITEDLLSINEAAAVLRVSPSTVWRWIDRGGLRAFRVGEKRVFIKRSDLDGVVKPARAPDKRARQPDGPMARGGDRLSAKNKRQLLAALASARKLQAELLAKRGGKLFSSSYLILDELRDQRSRDLG